ncbi:MAG: cohesin domain-containing protein [Dehalococcoidia bacterium]
MKGIKKLALGTAVAAFVAVGGLLLASQAFAASGSVQIGSGSAAVGEDGIVELSALDITAPGLGAWTVDVTYDPSVVTATACSATHGGVCNAEFADDQVRITGAVAEGLEGDSVLGTITFECGDALGESPLEVDPFTFADGTLGSSGGPQPIDAETVDGTFTCGPEPTLVVSGPPVTGTGSDSSNGITWIIVGLAALGLVSMATFGTLRLRERA